MKEGLESKEKIIAIPVGTEGTMLLVNDSDYPRVIEDLRRAGKLNSPNSTPQQGPPKPEEPAI